MCTVHDCEVEFPRVVALTHDVRVVTGRLMKDDVLLSSSLEIVRVMQVEHVPHLDMEVDAFFHPEDCPVVAYTLEGEELFGFMRTRWDGTRCVKTIDGHDFSLESFARLVPAVLSKTKEKYENLTSIKNLADIATISTSHGVWLVHKEFAEAYVDTWMQM